MRHLALSTIVAACLATVAAAAPVAFSASGTFTDAEGTLDPALVGQAFRFDIAYDTDASVSGSYASGTAQVAYYNLTSFVATVGGTSYDLNSFPQITVTADGSDSEFRFDGVFYPDAQPEGERFTLSFRPTSPLSSPTLPASVADLGTVTLAEYDDILGVGEFFTEGRATASTASIQAVPEPASLVVLSLGALGLIRRRR